MPSLVAGVDACRTGWVAVILSGGKFKEAFTVGDTSELFRKLEACDCVAIDMPIGLPTDGRRECDELAREFVGPRRSSVFFAPIREALLKESHKEATALSKERTGHGISIQAYSLREKIFDLEGALEADPAMNEKSFEVHPEVSFRELLNLAGKGAVTIPTKKSWAGQALRRSELEGVRIVVPDDVGDAGRVPTDDLLDAAIAAWTADRYQRDEADGLPEGARPGRRQQIWR